MRTLFINGNETLIAENFNELTKEQLLNYIVNFYLQLPRFFMENKEGKHEIISNDTYNGLLYAQLINLLQIDLPIFDKFTAEDVVFLLDEMKVLDFMLSESTLTINHFTDFSNKILGPENDFGDVNGEQFLWAENFYFQYTQTKEMRHLNAMIACLCKKVNKQKDVLPFSLKEVEVLEKYISEIPLLQKIATLLYFEGCRNEIPELYPFVFSGKKSKDGDFKEALLQVAKDGPFGDFDKVLKTNIHLIFSEFNRVAKEAIEFEKQNRA